MRAHRPGPPKAVNLATGEGSSLALHVEVSNAVLLAVTGEERDAAKEGRDETAGAHLQQLWAIVRSS